VFATDLQRYGFEHVGQLGELRRRDFPSGPGLYGLVVSGEVHSMPWVVRRDPGDGFKQGWIDRGPGERKLWLKTSELFYIGATRQGLRNRLNHYRLFAKGYHPTEIRLEKLNKMTTVYRLLRDICLQGVTVDVYVRTLTPRARCGRRRRRCSSTSWCKSGCTLNSLSSTPSAWASSFNERRTMPSARHALNPSSAIARLAEDEFVIAGFEKSQQRPILEAVYARSWSNSPRPDSASNAEESVARNGCDS